MGITSEFRVNLKKVLNFLLLSFGIILVSLLSVQYSVSKIPRCSAYEMRSIEGLGKTQCQRGGWPLVVSDPRSDFASFLVNWVFYLTIWIAGVFLVNKYFIKRPYITFLLILFTVAYFFLALGIYPLDHLAKRETSKSPHFIITPSPSIDGII